MHEQQWLLFFILAVIHLFLLFMENIVAEPIHDGGRVRRDTNYLLKDAKDTLGFIPNNYNAHQRPPYKGSNPDAVQVGVNLMITKIRSLDEKSEILMMEVEFQMEWEDPRLNITALSENKNLFKDDGQYPLNPRFINNIWTPDVFLDQLVSVSQPSLTVTPAAVLRVQVSKKDKNVAQLLFESRTTLNVICEMDYHFYPVDVTSCGVELKSYAYDYIDMTVTWKNRPQIMDNVDLPGFDLELVPEPKSQKVKTSFESFEHSAAVLKLYLKRRLNSHLIQTYLPSTFFVLISWLTFFIPDDHATERIGCSMVSLLSLMVMLDSLGTQLEQVTYLTGLHVWIVTCITFVFLSMMEILIVLKLWSVKKFKLEKESLEKEETTENLPTTSKTNHNQPLHRKFSFQSVSFTPPSPSADRIERMATSIEKVTPLALPLLFILFNALYWPWLLAGYTLEQTCPGNVQSCTFCSKPSSNSSDCFGQPEGSSCLTLMKHSFTCGCQEDRTDNTEDCKHSPYGKYCLSGHSCGCKSADHCQGQNLGLACIKSGRSGGRCKNCRVQSSDCEKSPLGDVCLRDSDPDRHRTKGQSGNMCGCSQSGHCEKSSFGRLCLNRTTGLDQDLDLGKAGRSRACGCADAGDCVNDNNIFHGCSRSEVKDGISDHLRCAPCRLNSNSSDCLNSHSGSVCKIDKEKTYCGCTGKGIEQHPDCSRSNLGSSCIKIEGKTVCGCPEPKTMDAPQCVNSRRGQYCLSSKKCGCVWADDCTGPNLGMGCPQYECKPCTVGSNDCKRSPLGETCLSVEEDDDDEEEETEESEEDEDEENEDSDKKNDNTGICGCSTHEDCRYSILGQTCRFDRRTCGCSNAGDCKKGDYKMGCDENFVCTSCTLNSTEECEGSPRGQLCLQIEEGADGEDEEESNVCGCLDNSHCSKGFNCTMEHACENLSMS